ELWKYHEGVRAILASDLTEFTVSGAGGTIASLRCKEDSSHHIPRWLDQYIESIGNAPHLFDIFEFNIAMARHRNRRSVQDVSAEFWNGDKGLCECALVPSQTLRDF